MARPVGWLGRLDSITKTVANSVRSHYDRADLAALFDLKERSMFALMGGASFSELSPPLLAAFIIERAPGIAPRTVVICG
jgi:hypothetical protein